MSGTSGPQPDAAALLAGAFAPPDYDGAALQRLNQINFELTNIFSDAGFAPIEPAILQPADILFDLYGEEIWERSFLLADGDHGAWCLRPDFTAPVARRHLSAMGPDASARYGYFGPVFRRARGQRDGALQQLQAGLEIIGEPDVAERDAEVFDLTRKALDIVACPPYQAVIGDLALIFSLLDALAMPATWRRRLRRHLRRPARFAALLKRFGGAETPGGAHRMAFLKGFGALGRGEAERAVAEMIALSETPQIGVRSGAEVAERFLRQAEDARAHPLPADAVALIEAMLTLAAPADQAPEALRALTRDAKIDLSAQIDAFERRLAALAQRGVEPKTLRFEAAFGRDLSYYDGFVFEMRPAPGSPAAERIGRLGGGGRYDLLFEALGSPKPVRGVGAAVKPEAILAAADLAAAAAEGGNAPAPAKTPRRQADFGAPGWEPRSAGAQEGGL